jgi:lipid-A-disaccharide synthase-like uncharacterized protein
VFQVLGILGVAISVAAYVPQVVHLWREGCSAGVSSRAWAMWLVSSVLILALALHQREPVFIALQVINLASITVTLLLARKYRGMVCEFHAHLVSKPPATTTGRTASPVSGIKALHSAAHQVRPWPTKVPRSLSASATSSQRTPRAHAACRGVPDSPPPMPDR